ncbi:MAG TPA: immunoglobulin domain-containing protein, partial [Verrucomicrobiae bacterium]|nr:immunoglobulin domain-containing protein [Verrucomicrobiae bacterium]
QQPQSKTVFAGSQASLQVVAAGSQPISYQWFFNGTNKLSGQTNSTLVLSNVQVSQTGPYTVFVSNRVSSLTSAAAQLTVREADFGDAQGPNYATLLVFNGAYHYISPGIYLGSRVDFEPDGQPAANASGDDLAGQDDEDGVSFVLPLLVGQQGRVNVTASTNGFLDAWIDFNGNGDWTDLGEQIFASRSLTTGNNSLQFTIPPSALAHGALARFRFSTTGGLLFSGGANDGEVEDHVATISPAVDLGVTVIDQPDPVLVGSNLHLLVTITNPGPSTATSVTFRETLPTSAAFVAMSLSQGSFVNQSGTLVCDIGSIPARSFVTADITLVPQGIGVAGHRAEVTSAEQDLNTTNNVATQLTTVVTAVGPFTNSSYIAINDFGPASLYPSTITVSGVTGTVHQVIVTLNSLSHVFPDDLDILLVGPRGQKVIIMSDAGGANDPGYITFSLDDSSDLVLPDEGLIIDEVYRPADYDPPGDADVFDAPAPPGPYTNHLAAFKGSDANGVWSLYIMDDFAQDNGELVGGWSLDFLVLDPISDGSVNIAATPSPVGVGQNVTFTLTVSNGGPSAVSSMLLTNVLPTNAVLQSFVPSQGGCTNVAGEIRCDFGVMEGGGVATLSVVVTPQQVGVLSNYARVTPSQLDLNQTNNTATLLTPVRFVADLSIAMSDSQDPVPAGQPFSYTLTVSNRGPQLAQAVVLTNPLPADFTFSGVTATQGSCVNQSGVVSCTLGDIAVGNFATIQISGQATRIGRIVNSASVQGNVVDGDLTNNQRSEETTVVFAAPPFANTNGITVPNPYPSTIQVSGLTGAVYKVSVVISNLTQSTPESLKLLLVGPSGQNVMLMNAVGGNNAISGRTLRLDDQAAVPLPDNTVITNGTYRPASYSSPSSLPAPAPSAPYGGALAVFSSTEGNGTWSLFTQGGGSIGAWWLEIFTMDPVVDLSVNVVSQPPAVSVGSNLTYTVTVSNRGPATATAIVLTNLLPGTLSVTTATGCTNVCNVGSLAAGAQLQFRVDGVALAEGSVTNQVSAFAAERDLNTTNNTAVAVTVMKNPPVFTSQPQNVTVTNGDSASFSVGVSGGGPFTYQWLRNGSAVSGATAATLVVSNAQQANAGLYAARVSDGVGSPLSATARLTVLNRPTISDITNITILEDTPSTDVPFVVSDLESSLLTFEVGTSNPALIPISNVLINGTGNNRTVKVLPTTNQFGIATITITVRDTDGISASDSFDVTVLAVNDLPVLGDIGAQVMDEDTQRSISLQASDVEDAPGQLSLSASVNDTNLLTAAIVNRTLTLTGLPNQFGNTRVTVFLTDSTGGTVSNAFDVTVSAINDPPTLNAIDAVFIDQKAGLTVVPLSGISGGPANEPQTVTVRAATPNTNLVGNLRVNYASGPSGSVSFETVSNFTGTTTITVTVDDGAVSNNIVSRTFGISIGDTNDPPTISVIADQIIAEDSSVQVNFTITDEETAASALALGATSSNTNLVRDATLVFSGTNTARSLSITPEPDTSGSAFITISVRDELDAVVTRSFRLDVSPVNDAPTLQVIPVLDLTQNAPTQIVPLTQISAGAPDEPHNLLITATSSNPSLIPDPIVSYNNPNSSGTLTLQPSGGSGTAVITIIANDRGASNNIITRTLTVNVSEQNRAPVISRIFNQATREDSPIDVPFTIFDPESPADTLALTASSANNALIPNDTLLITGSGTNRSLRAVPSSHASGTSTITITATDPTGTSSTATFVLEVTAVNDPPVIGDIPDQQINEDSAFGPFVFYVNDLETTPNALTLSALSSNPTLIPQFRISLLGSGTNRSVRIIPAQNQSGSAVITVTVRDGEGRTASDSFVLTVQATNDPPVISAIADQTINMNASLAIPFTINDRETDPDSLTLTVNSSNPAVLPLTNIILSGSSVNRSVLLTPLPNVMGTSIVTIVVADAQGVSASATFAAQVIAGSGPPFITTQPESLTVTNGGVAAFSVTASGTPTLRYRWRFNGTNLPVGTNFSYVISNAQPSDAGPYTVSIANSLGSLTSSVAILTVVNAGSTIPQMNTIADQTTSEDVPLPITLSLQDADTPGHFLILSATSTNTTLIPPSNYFFEGTNFTRTLTILPAQNQFGTNLITVTVSDGALSSSRSFVLRVTAVNDAPTLDRIPNISALANTQVTVPLTGISPGAPNETTTVNLTAAHNNTAVLTNLTINYTSGSSTGSLSVSVLSNATGSATITVTAVDGGPATLRTFQIVVRP